MDLRPHFPRPLHRRGLSAAPFVPAAHQRDPLTGLASRQSVLSQLRTWLDISQREHVAVVVVDVLRFGALNARYGEQLADRWLVAFSERLAACPWPGVVVGRLGGARFLLACRGEAMLDGGLVRWARRVARELAQPLAVQGRQISRRVRVGTASTASGEASVSALLAQAEQALGSELKGEQALQGASQALERAIADGREIEVYFQPEIDLSSGCVCGVEALARWRHPQRGLLPAARFIGLAERTGLVVPLSRLVLERSIEQGARWCHRHPGGAVVVRANISPAQLEDPHFIDELVGLLMVHQLPAQALCLEITEHTAMERADQLFAQLAELRDLGVQVAIDDFGVGHSSLARVSQMPADCLKIDRSFVAAISRGSRDRTLLGNIVAIARDCGLQVVAEGIETREQLAHLRTLDIERGQGALISPPLTASAAERLLGRCVCPAAAS